MSMASEVVKLIFAVSDVPFNSGHYTVIIKQQFLYTSQGHGHKKAAARTFLLPSDTV